MYKIGPENYSSAQPLLEELHIHQAVRALLNGDSPGEIYLDDIDHPRSVLAKTMKRFFLAGKSGNTAFNEGLKSLFDEEFYTRAIVNGEEGFSIFYSPGNWCDVINEVVLEGKHPIEDTRQYYSCRSLKLNWKEILPQGYSILKVDQQLLENLNMANLEYLVEEIFSECQSVDEFLSKRFGFCVVREHQIITWCLSEYNSGGRCEVGIATHPAHQRKGLAAAASLALIEYALGNGYQEVGWHCYSRNEASKAAALAAGFEEVSQYPAFWALYDETINLAVNGNLQFDRQAYQEAVQLYKKSVAAGSAPPWVFWNAACAYAQLDQRANAFDFLNRAVDQGFMDADQIKNSKQFEQWHTTEDWKTLIEKLGNS